MHTHMHRCTHARTHRRTHPHTLTHTQMAFPFLDKDIIIRIITTMIRLKLEYSEVIWSLHKKKHVLKFERIQRIATKMVPDLEDLTYEERLKEMHLTTLKERRELNHNI